MVTTMMIALGTIMGMSTVVATPTAQAADMPACWYTPTPEVQKNIQQQLYKLGLYKGNIDGKWLNLSIKAIQQAVYTWGGYTGPIDGAPGPNTCTNIQKLAGAKGQYTGSQDGVLGPRTWDGFLKALQAPPISVTSVKINPTGTITLKVGEKAALVAAVSPYTAWQKSVSWDSKYTSIATVTNGAVTAKTPGTTIITVTTKDGKRTDHVTVIVTGTLQQRIVAEANRTADLHLGWDKYPLVDGDGKPAAWCVYYVRQVLKKAGFDDIGTNSSSQLAYFAGQGLHHLKWVVKGPQTIPQPGDIIVWDWDKPWTNSPPTTQIYNPPTRLADHVSIVTVVTDYNHFTYVGGNQGDAAEYDDSKGLVTRETVSSTGKHTYAHILGFIRPTP